MSIPNKIQPPTKLDAPWLAGIIAQHSNLSAGQSTDLAEILLTEIRRLLGRRGGQATKKKYDREHYSKIGKMGGRPPMKQEHDIEK